MALLKFISLSVGSLMLFQGAYAQELQHPKATVASDCVTAMNEARKAVGLKEFTEEQKNLKASEGTGASENASLEATCKLVQNNSPTAASLQGTAAYFIQTEKNCATAIAKWKEGFSSFKSYTTEVPPKFVAPAALTDQTGDAPYNTADAINFVALYSAQSGAKVECAFLECPKITGPPAVEATKALVCITYPSALQNDQPPYSKDQWNNILKVFSPSKPSSASAAVPTLLALAAAAVGVALM